MGNLFPCCNPEEPHKPTAFSASSKNHSNQGVYPTGSDGKSSSLLNQNNASSTLSSSSALLDANNNNNLLLSEESTGAQDDANKIAMEERQRALLQEKERLQRIVNDASLNMVHVNGSNMRGMNAYYDPGYAADVWQDLIPGGVSGGGSSNSSAGNVKGRSSGGLIAKCGPIAPVKVHSALKVPTKNTNNTTAATTSGTSSKSLEKRLSKQFTLNGVVDREHIATLKEWIVAHESTTVSTTAKNTTTKTTNPASDSTPMETSGGSTEESIDILLDDLTEQFMATVLAQQSGRQFDGVDPIIENVL